MSAGPQAEEHDRFCETIESEHLRALWPVLGDLVSPLPRSTCRPYVWHYARLRGRLMEASKLITAEEAERRVLILENPGLPGSSQITTSMYCGIQLVMPGEIAPAHRHTQTALRLVLEAGPGGYTTVAGEKTTLSYGDFVITPNWAWHDHGNEGDQPLIWIDGLDIPVVQFLDASFAEKGSEMKQTEHRPEGQSAARYGANMLPLDAAPGIPASPLFSYPYQRSRQALETLSHSQSCDPFHGIKLRYTNPLNGDWAMSTIGASLQWMPADFVSSPYRSTDATVFVGLEGGGEVQIADARFHWKERDVFVCPSWASIVFRVEREAVLFSFSDRPVQEKLGLWREQRGDPDSQP